MEKVWNKKLSTGIEILEYQRNLLLETITKFKQAKTNKDIFLEVVIELQIYISTHFYTEERLMETLNYPDFLKHKRMHEEFVLGYREKFKKMLDEDSVETNPDLIEFVEKWLKEHLFTYDLSMINYIREYYENKN